jgi:hypothetical protein
MPWLCGEFIGSDYMNDVWDECSVKEKVTWVLVLSFAIGISIGFLSGAVLEGTTSRELIKQCQESFMKQVNETNRCCFAHGINMSSFNDSNYVFINGS